MKKVLVSVVGMSPAVLTETVWALAQEIPPVIPNEVVAITTLDGRGRLEKDLLQSGRWKALADSVGMKSPSPVAVIPGDGRSKFSDISTDAQNEAMADYILSTLRPYAEDDNTQIIASIAGGRKTMSALMLSCMSLLGRGQDRVCHVLANDEYLHANRNFCFPEDDEEARLAQIQLSDIPFVRIKKWQNLKHAPLSYSGLVHWINTGEFDYPVLQINPHNRTLQIPGGEVCRMGNLPFGLFYFWLQWMAQRPVCTSWADFREHLEAHLAKHAVDETAYEWAGAFERKYLSEGRLLADDDIIKKRMADARKKLEDLFRFPQLARTLIPDLQKKEVFAFPKDNIVWVDS